MPLRNTLSFGVPQIMHATWVVRLIMTTTGMPLAGRTSTITEGAALPLACL